MSELFKLSLEQLREKFVRTRFGEKDYFEFPDIEAWLERQRVAEKPDVSSWRRLFSARSISTAHKPEEVGRILTLGGYRLRDCPTNYFTGPLVGTHEKNLQTLLRALNNDRDERQGSCVYLGLHDDLTVVIYDYSKFSVYDVVTPYGGLMTKTVYGSLLRSWREHAWDNRELTLRATSARAELVHLVDCAVRKVRQSAESDFRKAIAVSNDGAEIVHAKHVYGWWSDNGTFTEFSPDTLGNNKALLLDPPFSSRRFSGEEWRLRSLPREDILKLVLPHLKVGKTEQAIVETSDGLIFITHESYLSPELKKLYGE